MSIMSVAIFFSTLATICVFIVYLGVIYWAYSPKQKERFSQAAQLPFSDEREEQS